jgi:hypothetical protein
VHIDNVAGTLDAVGASVDEASALEFAGEVTAPHGHIGYPSVHVPLTQVAYTSHGAPVFVWQGCPSAITAEHVPPSSEGMQSPCKHRKLPPHVSPGATKVTGLQVAIGGGAVGGTQPKPAAQSESCWHEAPRPPGVWQVPAPASSGTEQKSGAAQLPVTGSLAATCSRGHESPAFPAGVHVQSVPMPEGDQQYVPVSHSSPYAAQPCPAPTMVTAMQVSGLGPPSIWGAAGETQVARGPHALLLLSSMGLSGQGGRNVKVPASVGVESTQPSPHCSFSAATHERPAVLVPEKEHAGSASPERQPSDWIAAVHAATALAVKTVPGSAITSAQTVS